MPFPPPPPPPVLLHREATKLFQTNVFQELRIRAVCGEGENFDQHRPGGEYLLSFALGVLF